MEFPLKFRPISLIGTAQQDNCSTPLDDGTWYTVEAVDDGLLYIFEKGLLSAARFLMTDMLLEGNHMTCFMVQLQEGDDGPTFWFSFGLLNQCSGRLRVPLEAVQQNRWLYQREGAVLKRLARGERVDLTKVDRMRLIVHRKSETPVRWCMSPLVATIEEPPLLTAPYLPHGPLLNELGQSTLHSWPTKTVNEAEMVERLQSQLKAAQAASWPEDYSRWGGWMKRRFDATGFFRTHFAQDRWWMVDPDGYAFWSIGMDCVGPNPESAYTFLREALTWLPGEKGTFADAHQHYYDADLFGDQHLFNYLKANLIRAFGEDWHEKWSIIVLGLLKQWGFNTIANWSDWRVARQAQFPYVRQLRVHFPRSKIIYRNLPDVFHPDFEQDAAEYAEQLRETIGDPAMIGYFLINEPTWGFAKESPASGMLFNTPSCASRHALAEYLRERYGDETRLRNAWQMDVTLAEVAEGTWIKTLTTTAQDDLYEFSSVIVGKFFGTLNEACRRVDPDHLNLGARYFTLPPEWVAQGMQGFDVFSINCYQPQVPSNMLERIHELLNCPTIIGEWHFGALDAGLPASGIGRVAGQAARGQAYRVYVENAAALRWCVGTHYFHLYDQSALGRGDGENYNIGFLDICHHLYEPLAEAAMVTHHRVYPIREGTLLPYDVLPEYLPRTFL